ncbi:MAG: PilW family protein [Myxococcota bacterium]
MKRHRTKAGFTLIELMVALVAGVIAITTIYFVGAASSRHFHEQQRIAQTQMSVRMAMEQLRRDVQRAGFLGTPNSMRESRCGTPPPREVQAVEFANDDQTNVLPNAAQNGVTADTLRLTGNYATGDSYFVSSLTAAGSGVYLQQSWHGFRRDFGSPVNPDRFEAVFRPGRMLHLTTLQGKHFFVRITGNDPGRGQVDFTPALPLGGACTGGLADGAVVAPLSRIEYSVQNLADDPAGQSLAPEDDPAAAAFRGEAGAQLVRREIDFGGNPLPGSQRIVLENVAMVDYQFLANTAGAGLAPDLEVWADEDANGRLGDVNANAAFRPEAVMSVRASLSARTAEQDPRFPWVAAAAGTPATGVAPTRYKVVPGDDFQGAARVRTLRTEIFLPNVANRGLRGP